MFPRPDETVNNEKTKKRTGKLAVLSAGEMELVLILTSPLWPLALLAAVDWMQDSMPFWPHKVQVIARPRKHFQERQEDPEPETVEPPAFLLDAANLPDIVADRAMRSQERARRMGMNPSQHPGSW